MSKNRNYPEEPMKKHNSANGKTPDILFPLKENAENDDCGAEFEITEGKIDVFALKDTAATESGENAEFDIMSGEIEHFPIVKTANDSDAPDDAIDISSGAVDILELSETPLTKEESEFDIVSKIENIDIFALSEIPLIKEESDFDIVTNDGKHERFPLKENQPESDKKVLGGVGTPIVKTPLRTRHEASRKSIAAIVSAVVCITLTALLLWLHAGKFYTHKINESAYSKFLQGENMYRINENFDFFLSLGDLHLPVVRSDKPLHYTSFTGQFFCPGTLTSSEKNGSVTVTGATALLNFISSSLEGSVLIVEKHGSTQEYEIFSVHECEKDIHHADGEGILTVYAKDSSCKNGILALHARLK